MTREIGWYKESPSPNGVRPERSNLDNYSLENCTAKLHELEQCCKTHDNHQQGYQTLPQVLGQPSATVHWSEVESICSSLRL